MAILKFDQTAGKAFATGFLKGLAAPLELFRVDAVPAVPAPPPIEVPTRSVQDALAQDWDTLGRDFRAAIILHGQEAEATGRTETK